MFAQAILDERLPLSFSSFPNAFDLVGTENNTYILVD